MKGRIIAASLAAGFAFGALACGDERLRAEMTEVTDETRVDARFDPVEDVAPEEERAVAAREDAPEDEGGAR